VKTRIIVSVILLPVVIGLMWLGGFWLAGFVTAIAIIGQIEFYRAFGKLGIPHYAAMVAGVGLMLFLVLSEQVFVGLHMGLILITLVFVAPFFFTRKKPLYAAIFGFVYVVGLLSTVVVMRQQMGLWLTWLIFIAAWGSDTGAYFFGKAFGKRKLVPKLSPGKTVAGAVGGVATAMVLTVAYASILNATGIWELNHPITSLLPFAVYGLLGAVFAQGGDLAASALKRHVGIKDFGQLIPGHGGILDRFDSILFVAPLALIFFYIAL